MLVEIAHFLTVTSAVILLLILFLNVFFSFAKPHANQIVLSNKLFNQACFLIFISFGLYVYLAAIDDFSITYIANHSNSQLPVFYKITSIWSAHEGSMFLWIVFLTLWSVLFVNFLSLAHPLKKGTLLMLTLIILGFLLFLLVTSNPFDRILPFAAGEGADINPVLQDPALAIHPPMLYLGYVGFVISFSFITAYLFYGDFNYPWEKDIQTWSLVAWIFLTIGITLGSWWAYYELGWGGYWFWDPVENVALMPWLAATAFMHSLFASSKSGVLKTWTLFLGIMIFTLSLFGAFIVRSGIIDSVHSFANDPQRGMYLLGFSGFITIIALAVLAYRLPQLQSSKLIVAGSKESFLSMNNILMLTAIFSIFLGVTYPLILESLNGNKVSIGPPYYNTIFSPLILITSIFMMASIDGLWQRGMQLRKLYISIAPTLLVSGLGVYGIWHFTQIFSILAYVGILSGLLIIVSYSLKTVSALRDKTYLNKGSLLAHVGLGLLFFSISMNSILSYQKNINLFVGGEQVINSKIPQFQFVDLQKIKASNHDVISATIFLIHDDKPIYLNPEKRKYFARGQITSETAIHASFLKDTYLTIGDQLEDGSWTFSLQINYFVKWIWFSSALMAAGIAMTIFKKKI
ncbi:heme lyase CcmF/NrfE family subunit [Gammaproteobacteria bacterium]|nr:heme lyase CcmF/NrfE family subunit [Gammaproteobacteria bacterium]MDC1475781.1 heme lyase CcmF/NrfE family subunit [Gammaproteobacteria bacterium]|tara:strand:- start:1709 stop:3604 length:1896 start_codon:yes stop_codon:yes gene_type:complete